MGGGGGGAGEALATRTGAAPDEPILAFSGRNPKLKGLGLLLDALRLLQDRPWRCSVSGPRDAERWRRRIERRFGRPERFHVTPELDPLEVAAGADLCVLPSRRETCGLVVLEALACGTPVLVGEAVGAKEVLTSAEQGEVLPPRPRPAGLAARLDGLAEAPPDRPRIARAVRDRGLEPWLGALERELLGVRRPARGSA